VPPLEPGLLLGLGLGPALVLQLVWLELVLQPVWLVQQLVWLVLQLVWLVLQLVWLVLQLVWLALQLVWLVQEQEQVSRQQLGQEAPPLCGVEEGPPSLPRRPRTR